VVAATYPPLGEAALAEFEPIRSPNQEKERPNTTVKTNKNFKTFFILFPPFYVYFKFNTKLR
jgi:hypothetical protein